jgi:hypothetical protein
MKMDPELRAIQRITSILNSLDSTSRHSVINYLQNRVNTDLYRNEKAALLSGYEGHTAQANQVLGRLGFAAGTLPPAPLE